MPELKQVGGNMLKANTLRFRFADKDRIALREFKLLMFGLEIDIWELRNTIDNNTNSANDFCYTIWLPNDDDFSVNEEKILMWLKGYYADHPSS